MNLLFFLEINKFVQYAERVKVFVFGPCVLKDVKRGLFDFYVRHLTGTKEATFFFLWQFH